MAKCLNNTPGVHTQQWGFTTDTWTVGTSVDIYSNDQEGQNGCTTWPTEPLDSRPFACAVGDGNEEENFSAAFDEANGSGPGNGATVTYTYNGTSGAQTETGAFTDLSYRLVSCPSATGGPAECLSLEVLDVELPLLTIEGVTVEDAVIRVDRVKNEPVVSGTGSFTYGVGDIEATLSIDVGTARFTIPRENTLPVTGSLSPVTNSFQISDLAFNYNDSLINATLEVDVVGDYVNRAPRAGFVASSEPIDCALPVVFDEMSVDLDGDPMSHHWTVTSTGAHGSGGQFSVVLGAGDHNVVMWSSDGQGTGYHNMTYTRRCRP